MIIACDRFPSVRSFDAMKQEIASPDERSSCHPDKSRIQLFVGSPKNWIPAFAGMTIVFSRSHGTATQKR